MPRTQGNQIANKGFVAVLAHVTTSVVYGGNTPIYRMKWTRVEGDGDTYWETRLGNSQIRTFDHGVVEAESQYTLHTATLFVVSFWRLVNPPAHPAPDAVIQVLWVRTPQGGDPQPSCTTILYPYDLCIA